MSSLASVSDSTFAALAKTGSSSSGPVALTSAFAEIGPGSLLRLTLSEPDDVLQLCEVTVLNHPIGFIDT